MNKLAIAKKPFNYFRIKKKARLRALTTPYFPL